MARRSLSTGPVPPAFVMAEHLRELPDELAVPLRLLFALRSCMQRVNADLTRWLGPDALSPGRMQMLMLLWASKAPVRQSELVRHMAVSRASVSELVEALEREQLVTSVPDPDHGRRMLVTLTGPGRETARTQIHGNAGRLRRSFANLSADEQGQLIDLLGRMCRDAEGGGDGA